MGDQCDHCLQCVPGLCVGKRPADQWVFPEDFECLMELEIETHHLAACPFYIEYGPGIPGRAGRVK